MKITVKKPKLNVDTYRLKLVVAMLTNPTLGPACSATVRKAIETCSAPSGLDEKLEPLTELYSLAQQDSESALELIEAAEKIRAENVLRDADSIENGEIPPAMRLHAALLERATQFKRRLHNVIKLGEHELGRKMTPLERKNYVTKKKNEWRATLPERLANVEGLHRAKVFEEFEKELNEYYQTQAELLKSTTGKA